MWAHEVEGRSECTTVTSPDITTDCRQNTIQVRRSGMHTFSRGSMSAFLFLFFLFSGIGGIMVKFLGLASCYVYHWDHRMSECHTVSPCLLDRILFQIFGPCMVCVSALREFHSFPSIVSVVSPTDTYEEVVCIEYIIKIMSGFH